MKYRAKMGPLDSCTDENDPLRSPVAPYMLCSKGGGSFFSCGLGAMEVTCAAELLVVSMTAEPKTSRKGLLSVRHLVLSEEQR